MKKTFRYFIIATTSIIGLFILLKFLFFPLFVQHHNNKVLAHLKSENAKSYAVFTDFIIDIENKTDWNVLLTSGYRTIKEQEILNRKDPRNADAGQSKHNFGKAIDLNLYQNTWITGKWLMKSSTKNRWEYSGILKIAQKHNLKWGGHFKSYYDPVHFEVE